MCSSEERSTALKSSVVPSSSGSSPCGRERVCGIISQKWYGIDTSVEALAGGKQETIVDAYIRTSEGAGCGVGGGWTTTIFIQTTRLSNCCQSTPSVSGDQGRPLPPMASEVMAAALWRAGGPERAVAARRAHQRQRRRQRFLQHSANRRAFLCSAVPFFHSAAQPCNAFRGSVLPSVG